MLKDHLPLQPPCRSEHVWNGTCDVVLLEGVAVDLVLIGTVFLQPFAHVLLGPQGHRLGQLHISWLRRAKTKSNVRNLLKAYWTVALLSFQFKDPLNALLKLGTSLVNCHFPTLVRSHDVRAAHSACFPLIMQSCDTLMAWPFTWLIMLFPGISSPCINFILF